MGVVPFDRPLPIAVALSSFHPGGTERQMTELVRRLDPQRWEVHVVSFTKQGEWFTRASECAASFAEFPISGFTRIETAVQVRRFARWCHEQRISLVHTSDFYTNIFFLPAAALARVPVRIGSRREIAAGKSRSQIAVQRAAYACAHRVVVNAAAVAARLERERVSPTRVSVVPNGIDLTLFRGRGEVARRRRIVMVANLRPGKGHDTLIDAAPGVLQRVPDAHFEIVGQGSERASLESRASDRGVSHAFTFTGHSDDVPATLTAGEVFTLPSDSEAFPNAVLEAMAAGLPVVASAVGGVAEVVRDGHTGLLVHAPRSASAG
jgi:L-malate glycosyltransferase